MQRATGDIASRFAFREYASRCKLQRGAGKRFSPSAMRRECHKGRFRLASRDSIETSCKNYCIVRSRAVTFAPRCEVWYRS